MVMSSAFRCLNIWNVRNVRNLQRKEPGHIDLELSESNTWCARLTAAMILSGSAVQLKGLGASLVSDRKRLIAACRSTIERKAPRLRRRLVSLAKKPSTAFSQDAEVGVKWNAQRGWRSSQARTLGCLFGQVEARRWDVLARRFPVR